MMSSDHVNPWTGRVLLLQVMACLFMTGVIWFVQIVHYPLFGQIGVGYFGKYEEQHTLLTTFVVLPPMFVELLTAGLLLHVRPHFVSRVQSVVILMLTVAVWLLTFLVHVPQHDVLGRGYSGEVHAALVSTNWLRTALWSVKSAVLLRLLHAGVQANLGLTQLEFSERASGTGHT